MHAIAATSTTTGLKSDPDRRTPGSTTHARKPGLDFVVCGMPRGGTTFFAQFFNVHEAAYCYFMETGLFRQLYTFGRDRPFPAANLDALEQWLRAEFRVSLVDGTEESRVSTFRRLVRYRELMDNHGLAEPSGPGIRVWDQDSVETFLQDVLDLFRRGLYGEELFQQGMQLLRRELERVSARAIMGEKTPDNVLFLDALHAADPQLKAFCMLREPYSTLESMKRRAQRNEPFYDSAFSKELLGGLANYYTSIRAAHAYALQAEPGIFHVYRFEDLVDNPASVMERVFSVLGLEMTEAARQLLPQLVIPTDRRHIKDLELSATEHRLIQLVLGPMLAHFGYEVDLGKDPDHPDVQFTESVLALSGIYLEGEPADRIDNRLMTRQADAFVLFADSRQSLELRFDSLFPPALGIDEVTVSVQLGCGEPVMATIPSSSQDFAIRLPLVNADSIRASGSMRAAHLRIKSSASFVPITVDGCGLDLREFSLRIRSCTFG